MPATKKRVTKPKLLAWTPDVEAQRLAAQDWVAFVVGFILDQQIRIQQAFNSPLELQRRLGHLDAKKIAEYDLDELVEVFAESPPLHRFPRAMATRVRDCMRFIIDEYGGDPSRVWTEAADTADVKKRIAEMPGFGKMKAMAVTAVLARHFQMDFPGWDEGLPPYGALAYVDSLDDLKEYQRKKGEYKKAAKAKAGS